MHDLKIHSIIYRVAHIELAALSVLFILNHTFLHSVRKFPDKLYKLSFKQDVQRVRHELQADDDVIYQYCC